MGIQRAASGQVHSVPCVDQGVEQSVLQDQQSAPVDRDKSLAAALSHHVRTFFLCFPPVPWICIQAEGEKQKYCQADLDGESRSAGGEKEGFPVQRAEDEQEQHEDELSCKVQLKEPELFFLPQRRNA